MNIWTIVLLAIAMMMNVFIIVSMSIGSKGIKDKTSRLGLSALKICLVADVLMIIGGVVAW